MAPKARSEEWVCAKGRAAFTLVELLVATAVLALLLVLIAQLFNSTALVTSMGNKHMDADAQARALLDRMSVDFGAMVKRADVDYYLKGRPATNNQPGNDQIAFYSEVPGYYPSSSNNSPVSVVAYRLNPATHRVERLGKGLQWNGVSTSETPVVFLPIPLASPLPSPLPTPMPATPPAPAWPEAANMTADADYEQTGPQVFRFEYYYLLKGSTSDATSYPSALSDTPWDVRVTGRDSVSGLRDVAAIGVAIAVIDSKTRVLVSDTQLTALADQMNDFDSTKASGSLEAQWQAALNASTLPRVAASAIRVYGRQFRLSSAQ